MHTRRRANPGEQASGPEPETTSDMEEDEENGEQEDGRSRAQRRAGPRGAAGKLARPSASGLPSNTAALLDVLGLPSVQQCLQSPPQPALAAAKEIARLGQALGSPGDPGVKALLLSLWETLEPPAGALEPAEPWHADLPRTLDVFDVDASSVKVPAFKALCRAFQLPLAGKKADLQDRLRPLLLLLPQRVPLLAALKAQPDIARKVKARSALSELAKEPDVEGYAGTLSASQAKSQYCLNDSDLKVRPAGCGNARVLGSIRLESSPAPRLTRLLPPRPIFFIRTSATAPIPTPSPATTVPP